MSITTPMLMSVLLLTAPQNQTEAVDPSVAEKGTAPFLGVRLLDVPPVLAAHLKIPGGALIADVVPGSPAEKAGLARHDVVIGAGDEAVASPAALRDAIRGLKSEDTLELKVLRDGEEVAVTTTLGVVAASPGSLPPPAPPPVPRKMPGFLGVRFAPVPVPVAAHLGLVFGSGVSVSGVLEKSPAAGAGIETHDVILEISDEAIMTPRDLPRLLGQHREGDEVKIVSIHRGERRSTKITLGGQRPEIHDFPPGHPEFHDDRLPGRGFGPGRRLPRRHSLRGRLFWKDADGKERVFELPEFDVPDPGEWSRPFKHGLEGWKTLPHEFHGRIEKLLEKYRRELKDFDLPDLDDLAEVIGAERHQRVIVSRTVADGYDITVRDDNGRRTVTVRKDGETLAKELDLEKLETLPGDVQKRVRAATAAMPELEGTRGVRPATPEKTGQGLRF